MARCLTDLTRALPLLCGGSHIECDQSAIRFGLVTPRDAIVREESAEHAPSPAKLFGCAGLSAGLCLHYSAPDDWGVGLVAFLERELRTW
jgi:hypothetical protein